MSERDTHFAGFAELLWDELHTLYAREVDAERYEETDKQIIARFLYDFATHIHKDAPVTEWEWEVKDIPDMAEWPEKPV